jgi:hypothetical protein
MRSDSKPAQTLSWCQITAADGSDLGNFAIGGESMIVRSSQGWEKIVRAGPHEAWAGLAMLVASASYFGAGRLTRPKSMPDPDQAEPEEFGFV